MSMSEPLLPHARQDDDETVAAEPGGEGAPLPAADEEPDVIDSGDDSATAASSASDPADPPFRTPTPGDSLTAEELAAESGD